MKTKEERFKTMAKRSKFGSIEIMLTDEQREKLMNDTITQCSAVRLFQVTLDGEPLNVYRPLYFCAGGNETLRLGEYGCKFKDMRTTAIFGKWDNPSCKQYNKQTLDSLLFNS